MTNRIDTTLAALKAEGRSALAPFVTVGYPDLAASEAMAASILDAGADMLELGIPFSDPPCRGADDSDDELSRAGERHDSHGKQLKVCGACERAALTRR